MRIFPVVRRPKKYRQLEARKLSRPNAQKMPAIDPHHCSRDACVALLREKATQALRLL